MENDLEIVYWIFLGETLGYGSSKIKKISQFFKSGTTFYKSGIEEWKKCDFLKKKDLLKLETKKLKDAENIYTLCKSENYEVIPYTSEKYPKILKSINNPPAVLYISGNLPKLDNTISIAIVGTRNPTAYGKNVAFNFGYNLASSGVVVVSGGALGVDSAAQHGGIMAGGKIISVLGCGFKSGYLVKNEKLRELTRKNGALVSEYPPYTPAIPRNFPIRNRIISGISSGILVVEAGEKSGSLITASIAEKQNKKIFSIPGNIDSQYSIGTNNMIKSGAKPVTHTKDILEEFFYIPISPNMEENFKKENKRKPQSENILTGQEKIVPYPTSILEDKTGTSHNYETQPNSSILGQEKPDTPSGLKDLSSVSENGMKVYKALPQNSSTTLDSIVFKTGLSVSTVLKSLTELEILDLTTNLPGGKYVRK